MARRFAKVSEEEIKTAFFYPSDLVNTKTTIPLRVGEERWIYTSTLRVSVYIHHYSPPLRGIVVYHCDGCPSFPLPGGSWLGCQDFPALGAVSSRSWLPIVEALGCLGHSI